MKKLSLLLMLVFVASLVSCSKDDSGTTTSNSEAKLGVEFITHPSAATAQKNSTINHLNQALAGTLSFTNGYIAISELEFEAETENDSIEIEFELEQNSIIDFATGTTSPDISYVTIPAGTYEEVEVEMELRSDSEEPAILLYGTYVAPDGVEHNIRFEYSSDESFEVEREGVINLEENEIAIAQITFNPLDWFAAVTDEDFANATTDADGIIVISSTQNPQIYDMVAEGLELASDVEIGDDDGYYDDDDDGDVNDDDDDED